MLSSVARTPLPAPASGRHGSPPAPHFAIEADATAVNNSPRDNLCDSPGADPRDSPRNDLRSKSLANTSVLQNGALSEAAAAAVVSQLQRLPAGTTLQPDISRTHCEGPFSIGAVPDVQPRPAAQGSPARQQKLSSHWSPARSRVASEPPANLSPQSPLPERRLHSNSPSPSRLNADVITQQQLQQPQQQQIPHVTPIPAAVCLPNGLSGFRIPTGFSIAEEEARRPTEGPVGQPAICSNQAENFAPSLPPGEKLRVLIRVLWVVCLTD
jgi:hypothetical protein